MKKSKLLTANQIEKIIKNACRVVISIDLEDKKSKNKYQSGTLYIKADDKDFKETLKYCKKYRIKIPAELVMPSNILYIGEL